MWAAAGGAARAPQCGGEWGGGGVGAAGGGGVRFRSRVWEVVPSRSLGYEALRMRDARYVERVSRLSPWCVSINEPGVMNDEKACMN